MLADGGHETWTVDLRGHGESDWSVDGDYSTESMVEDLVEVCDRLPAPPIVVGASMGGLVALVAEGLLHPGRFHALVLVDIATRIEAAGVERIVSFMGAAPDGFASLEEAAESVAAYRPDQPRRTGFDGLSATGTVAGTPSCWVAPPPVSVCPCCSCAGRCPTW